jgi:lipoate-protein ligase A
MLESWRLLDTGLGSAARNIALSRALLEARHADESASTLRFLRFAPGVLLGSTQSALEEFDPLYWTTEKVVVQRRITGGFAWVVDERQLGWELYLHRRELGNGDMDTLAKRIGHAAATALAALGVDARYRARDEIEIEGRSVGMLGYAAEGGGLLFQSLLLIDPDFERMARMLRSPALHRADLPQPSPQAVNDAIAAVQERRIGLRQALGRNPDLRLVKRNLQEAFESEFDVEFREGDLSLTEHARYQRAIGEIDTPGWIDLVSRRASEMPLLAAVHRVAGGALHAKLRYQPSSRRIKEVWFSGNVAINPRRTLRDLEATLRDVPMHRLEQQVRSFFASRTADCGALRPIDFIGVVRLAVGEPHTASSDG